MAMDSSQSMNLHLTLKCVANCCLFTFSYLPVQDNGNFICRENWAIPQDKGLNNTCAQISTGCRRLLSPLLLQFQACHAIEILLSRFPRILLFSSSKEIAKDGLITILGALSIQLLRWCILVQCVMSHYRGKLWWFLCPDLGAGVESCFPPN